jgi:hypothetical protein
VQTEYRDATLIVCMKAGHVVRYADSGKHSHDGAEKAAPLKHAESLRYSGPWRNDERGAEP